MDQEHNNEFPPGEPGEHEGGAEETLDTGRPAVAAAPGKIVVVVVLALVFIAIVIKSLFFGSKSEKPLEKHKPQPVAPATHNNISENMLPAPAAFNAPPPVAPPVQPPPPPPTMTPPPPQISAQSGPTNEQLKARIHSPMISGKSLASSSEEKKKKSSASSDPNSAFAQSVEDSSAETVEATQVKNLNRTIVQGKLIQAVLESAIDSTLPGTIRAIVSHDTYAESGRAILIPKGSRLIGTYNSSVRRGQARVFIIWTRVVRPDGVDVAINSPGVEALGRAGMAGDVDNKYFEAFSTALLTSALDVGVAAIGDALFGNQQQTTTSGPNGYTTVSSPTATAMQTAVQNIGSVGQTIVNSTANIQPSINIDQGQVINIFVNKDIVFPSGGIGAASIIP